jgi:hypothetical protein
MKGDAALEDGFTEAEYAEVHRIYNVSSEDLALKSLVSLHSKYAYSITTMPPKGMIYSRSGIHVADHLQSIANLLG